MTLEKKHAACGVLLAAMMQACSSLEPLSLPAAQVPEPAIAPVWQHLAALPSGDHYVLLNDGMTALDQRLRAIDSASESIDLQTFLWRFDEAGGSVAAHLLEAADRGVAVRILVDDSFLLGEDAVLRFIDEHPNIEYRIYNPHRTRADDAAVRSLSNLIELRRLDHRMHNKAMIVDNRVAIVGGRNLADEYFGLHGSANFRDLEVILAGPQVGAVSEAFITYWNAPWSLPIRALTDETPERPDFTAAMDRLAQDVAHTEPGREMLAQHWQATFADADSGSAEVLFDTPPQDNPASPDEAPVQVAGRLVDLLDAAREEIVILSAYLIPTPTLEGAVARAIERGVRVRVLTNSLASNNHVSAHSAYSNHVRTLLGHGVELHEVRTVAADRHLYMLEPTAGKALALHAKALLVDGDTVFVGSANLDPRSLRINTEMGLLVRSRGLNERLRRAFEPDFADSNAWELTLDGRGRVLWRSGDIVLDVAPANSFMQRIEDWFLARFPLEAEL